MIRTCPKLVHICLGFLVAGITLKYVGLYSVPAELKPRRATTLTLATPVKQTQPLPIPSPLIDKDHNYSALADPLLPTDLPPSSGEDIDLPLQRDPVHEEAIENQRQTPKPSYSWSIQPAKFAKTGREAFVFQAFNEVRPKSGFATSLYVAAYSIRKTGTSRRIVVQITADSKLDPDAVEALGLELVDIDYIPMDMRLCTRKLVAGKERLAKAGFTMLRVLEADFETVFYMDSDLLVLGSLDHLFQLVNTESDAASAFPCALSPVGDNPCGRPQATIRANVGVMLIKPSKELFSSAMERIKQPYKCGVGSQDMLKSWFRASYGPFKFEISYRRSSELEADVASLSDDGPRPKLQKPPPKGGPAWTEGVLRGYEVHKQELLQARARLKQGSAKLTFYSSHGRKRCACFGLKYNCKQDKGNYGKCRRDVGDEAVLHGAADARLVVRHWSGESKPWSHWWNSQNKQPKRGLSGEKKVGVLEWWKYKEEMEQFVNYFKETKRR